MHFYTFDDKLHDILFVQHCFLMHNRWLKDQGSNFEHHWVWFDGAASQFKASRPFYFVGKFYNLIGTEMTWSYLDQVMEGGAQWHWRCGEEGPYT